MGDNPTVTVTADSKKRVLIPTAKPGDCFEITASVEGSILLTRMEPAEARPATVRVEKRGRFSVGVLDRPINEAALKEALEEFP